MRTGVSVMDKIAAMARIKVFVHANGPNNFPSWPDKRNTGKNETTIMIVLKNTPRPTC